MITIERKIELFELVKTNLETDIIGYDTGICQVVNGLNSQGKCSTVECVELLHTLRCNKPKSNNEYRKFYHNKYWGLGRVMIKGYWWEEMHIEPKTRQIRVDYLTALIENLKSKII